MLQGGATEGLDAIAQLFYTYLEEKQNTTGEFSVNCMHFTQRAITRLLSP